MHDLDSLNSPQQPQHEARTLAVGDDNDAAAKLGERCAEGAQRLAVQVVGRLIQHHHVRVLWSGGTYESIKTQMFIPLHDALCG